MDTVSPLKNQHVTSAKQFDRALTERLLIRSAYLESEIKSKGKLEILRGKVVALLFCEASTRTSSSFSTAATKLGADVLTVNWENSSAKKGETMQDTLRTLEGFSDAIVMRHPEKGIHDRMKPYLQHPILNAGDGAGEHPSQALLDLYTIYRELGTIDGLTVTLLGDLKYGRTVHSLLKFMSLFDGLTVNLVCPESLSFPEELLEEIKTDRIRVVHSTELTTEIIKATDVLYVTRLQRERFTNDADFLKIRSGYNVSKETLTHAKEKMVVMHPLPRVDELNEDLDSDPRAAYFKQVAYGVFMRAALLEAVLA
jgi:carbamoyl-phosphate synthase/aspartate carbamoyltransferase